MLDGVTNANGWTNRYVEPATNILPSFSLSHASDWVTVLADPEHTGTLTVFFTTNANNQLPAAMTVSSWNGADWVPVSHHRDVGDGVQRADDGHVRPGEHDEAQARHDEPVAEEHHDRQLHIAELQATGNVVTPTDRRAELAGWTGARCPGSTRHV